MKKSCISVFILICILVILSCGREKKTEKESSEVKTETTETVSLKSVGLAYLEENNLEKAEEQFLQLIQISPEDASGYANLGVVYLRMGRLDDAEKYLLKAVDLAPNEADIRVNLAKVYEMKDNHQSSLEQLKKSEDADPEHVKTLYSLAEKYEGGRDTESVVQWESYMKKIVESSPTNIVARLYLVEALIQNKKDDEALKNLEEVQKIFPAFSHEASEYLGKTIESLQNHKASDALTSLLIFHNFLKLTAEYQSGIRELKGTQGAAIGVPVITMNQNKGNLQEGESILDIIRFTDATGGAELDIINSRLSEVSGEIIATIALGDMDRDGDHDIYYGGYIANKGQAFHYLLQSDFGRFKDITPKTGINHGGRDQSATFIDYDNDGFLDVFVANESANVLYGNVSEGKFSDVTKQARLSGNGKNVLFVDLDHEGDLDFILSRNGKNAIWQNNGDKTFSEISASSGLAANSYESTNWAFGDLDNDGDIDLLVANTHGPLQVFSNSRKGVFMDITEKSRINFPSGSNDVEVFDYDNDGNMDVLAVSEKGIALFRNSGAGYFIISDHSEALNRQVSSVACLDASVVDFDNDGFTDIIFVGHSRAAGGSGLVLAHNDGSTFSDASYLLPENTIEGRQVAIADYNQDGDQDIFMVETHGRIRLLRNDGANTNHYLKLQLVGLRSGSGKNNYFGIGAEVEVRAGDLYQKKLITEPGLLFGIGQRDKVDVVRILWTNGVPQNIFSPSTDQDLIEEQELKGSCPFLYTWDGGKYTFVKDMMWRSALGMPLGIMGGKATYAFADASAEYLKIPGEMLQVRDGKYTIQMTEELWETIYCDEIKLLAVDHPDDVDIYVDEKFAAPPYAPLKIFTVKKHQKPIAANDGVGNDLLDLIEKKDDRYIANFEKEKFQGITEMHDLVLDFGSITDIKNLHLFLNGWIFPTDASINVAISQSDDIHMKSPSLSVINAKGEWQEVIPNIGFPGGKNKMVIVNLEDKFLTNDRKVRIRTNMEIYWDYAFVAKDEKAEITITKLNPETADYHYRGFSAQYRKEGRYGPHWFDYSQVSTGQKWRDLTGTYTRYGDVTELLQDADDMYIIANAGDETTISFEAQKAPKLHENQKRDFLIYSVGWVKDGDLNTALGQTVEPLPFHGMSRYPYGKDEHYPTTPAHKAYQEKYNTRLVGIEQFRGFVKSKK